MEVMWRAGTAIAGSGKPPGGDPGGCRRQGLDFPGLAYILATDDAAGRPALSHQERRALQLYATGMPMKSVAEKMTISDETVKQYLAGVREKYARAGRAAPTKLELYYRAVEDGHLLPPS
jgi:hypothetical protein